MLEVEPKINSEKELLNKFSDKLNITKFKKKHGEFWKHPEFDTCYIPIQISTVLSKDKVNTIGVHFEDNEEYSTLMTQSARVGGEDWSREEYMERFCVPGNITGSSETRHYYVGQNVSLNTLKTKFKNILKYVSNYLLYDEGDNDTDNGTADSESDCDKSTGGDYVLV